MFTAEAARRQRCSVMAVSVVTGDWAPFTRGLRSKKAVAVAFLTILNRSSSIDSFEVRRKAGASESEFWLSGNDWGFNVSVTSMLDSEAFGFLGGLRREKHIFSISEVFE